MRSRHGSISRFVMGLGLAGMVLAACGGNDPSTASAPPTTVADGGVTVPATTPAPAPVLTNPPATDPVMEATSGGTLVVALDAESTGFNPTIDIWGDAGHNVARAIFDTLATYAPDGSIVPYLADSITATPDATVWTIKVRSGITFHNGEPLNAAAVQQNFQATLDSPGQLKTALQLVKSMKVLDDLTLEVTMSAPWGSFPNSLTGGFNGQAGYMGAPAMLAKSDGGRNPIGTGPFVFSEWTPDFLLTVTRNDGYWQQPAYLDKVEFRPIPDSTVRQGSFDAGDTTLYYTASASEVGSYLRAQDAGDVHVTVAPPSTPEVTLLNTAKPPLDDLRVRQALAMSIDLPRIIAYTDGVGVKQPMHGPYADDSFWYLDTGYPTYDVAEATRLVDEYEAEKGPIKLEYAGNQDPWVVSYMELFQSMWKDVGIEVSIVSKAQSDNISSVFAGDYQITGWGGIGGDDPDNDYIYFHSSGPKITGFTSPEMDAAMDAGRALSDPAERKAQYDIVQQILTDNLPYLWLYTNQFAVITGSKVHGIEAFTLPDGSPGRPLTSGRFFLKDVWIEP